MQQHSRFSQFPFKPRLNWVVGMVFALLLSLSLSTGANAASAFQQSRAQSFVQPNRAVGLVINLNRAIAIVKEESGGKVLSAKSVRSSNGTMQHQIRMLIDDQRVTTWVVDQQGRLRRKR